PITQVDRVIQPEDQTVDTVFAREVFKDALAPEAGVGVFTTRIRRVAFDRALGVQFDERVDVAGGKRNDSRRAVTVGYKTRQIAVDCPGQIVSVGRAKFSACEKEY